MKPVLLLLLSNLFCILVFSQASDFIVVKKHNNITIKSFFPGIPINLQTTSGSWVNGDITAIRNDSVFIREYDIRQVPTPWAAYKLDTVGIYVAGVHYTEIKQVQVDTKGKAFAYVSNGAIFMIGGIGYALLNVINGQYLHESLTANNNIKSLGIALGVAGFGFILNRIDRLKNKHWKYVVEYVRMNDVKKQLRGF